MSLPSPKFTVVTPLINRRSHTGFVDRLFDIRSGSIHIIDQFEQFRQWASHIDRVVIGSDQHSKYAGTIAQMFECRIPEVKCHLHRISSETGPSSIASATAEIITACGIQGSVVVFDPTLPMSIDSFFAALHHHQHADVAVSVNSINGHDLRRWPVVSVGRQGVINDIVLNKTPRATGRFQAAGGLYWFRDSDALYETAFDRSPGSIVEIISSMIDSGLRVEPVASQHFEAFDIRSAAPPCGTVFCDLDGTLIRHEDRPQYDKPLQLLPGSKEAINSWISNGYSVVLVTARDSSHESLLRRALAEAGIVFHGLLTGLPSGPRYVINDRKPSSGTTSQAAAFEVSRDTGVRHLSIRHPKKSTIKRRFPGGSFAETLLIENDEGCFVRKRVSKDVAGSLGQCRLKQQYSTLQRFASLNPMSIPELLGEHDCSLEYYFDMQYLQAHKSLNSLNEGSQRIALGATIQRLFRDNYDPTAQSMRHGSAWLRKHLDQKIYPKLAAIGTTPELAELVGATEIVIDSQVYAGIESSLGRLVEGPAAREFVPKTFSLIHGDLTFENVLCAGHDIRLIDMDGGGDTEPPELDLGKLLQSLVARYETWAHNSQTLVSQNDEGLSTHVDTGFSHRLLQETIATWANHSKADTVNVLRIGLFYMALHLIRMTPFRLRVSVDQARYALTSATRWLSHISAPSHEFELPDFARSI